MSENMIATFFNCLDRIHAGEESAVDDMLTLWDKDGRWTFNGAHPIAGEFRGKLAIDVYLRNLVHSCRMPVRYERHQPSTLQRNDVELTRVFQDGENWIAEWNQVVATEDRHGTAFGGSSAFRFVGEKIGSIDVTVWPRQEAPRVGLLSELNVEELTVTDVGRLALAAWAVV